MSINQPMSSADRVAARGRKPPSAAKQVTLLAVGVCCAAAIGYCLSSIISDEPPWWAFAAIPLAIALWVSFLVVTSWASNHVFGAGATRPIVSPGAFLAAICAAGGITVWACARSRPLPELAYLIPLALAVIFACLAGLGAARRAARRRARESVVRTTTTGVITDDGLAAFHPGPNPKLARLTVRFVDGSGQERWVQPLARQLDVGPLAVGDEVRVGYDPGAPADLRRIVVEADNGTSQILPAPLR